jgi:superfamily II DNA/RNA helicase
VLFDLPLSFPFVLFAQSRLRREPPHAIVATPALAASLVASGHVSLRELRLLVLDEADELLSPAAAPATRALLAAAGAAARAAAVGGGGGGEAATPTPPLRRVWVSATVTPAVVAAAAEAAAYARVPHPPVLLSDAAAGAAAAATSAAPPPPAMSAVLSHWRLELGTLPTQTTAVAAAAPAAAASDAAAAADAALDAAAAAAAAAVARLHAALTPKGPILVFAPSGGAAPSLLAALRARAFRAAALTATQPAERRERAAVLRGVRAGRTQVLVTTEMGARGMDLPAVALVVNAGAPLSHGAYLHRAGRAGRSAPGCIAPTPVRFCAFCVMCFLRFCVCVCAACADACIARCVRRGLW